MRIVVRMDAPTTAYHLHQESESANLGSYKEQVYAMVDKSSFYSDNSYPSD